MLKTSFSEKVDVQQHRTRHTLEEAEGSQILLEGMDMCKLMGQPW